ncbi:hypothetical protein SAY86_002693 [Trapa natans]|uniref:Ureide permease n=1 Tax=Trapa natans TaxID=22666 RepID=A0AAN7QZT6_TRANT|nr:hypothetical protein SAY86_002693 [Trapa natans]
MHAAAAAAAAASSSSLSRGGLDMYMVESKAGAIVCILLSLFFLGTWPAIFTHLERWGRLPQHTYLDYSITNLIAAVIVALTLGELGKGTPSEPNFLDQLFQAGFSTLGPHLQSFLELMFHSFSCEYMLQDNWPSVLFALSSGVFIALGNLATQYALAFAGLSITLVVTASMTVIIGTSVNYYLDDKINKAEILFPGVGCFIVAVFIASAVHASNEEDKMQKLSFLSDEKVEAGTNIPSELFSAWERTPSEESSHNEDVGVTSRFFEKAEAGTAHFLVELEHKRAIKVFGKNKFMGLGVSIFAGLCFSFFSPLFNLATNDQFHTLKEGVPHLTVYTAFFYFSVSCFLVSAFLNVGFLYHPMMGLPESSCKSYATDWDGRSWALLSGLLCGFGNGLQFMGGEAAGYAAADAVQALPLVSTFWAIVVFGEYQRSSRRTYILLGSMLFMFIVAVLLLMISAGHRDYDSALSSGLSLEKDS